MKLKTLGTLCKQEGTFFLYDQIDTNGEVYGQWLGTHGAVFQLAGLPYLTEDHLAALFDIADKQRKSLYFNQQPLPETINFDDVEEGETLLEREKLTLGYGGRTVHPYITRGGLEFIDTAYFSPLADVADTLELYERSTTSGGTYFVAKTGLIVVAVIMPMSIIEEKLVHHMETLAVKCRAALEEKQRRERVKAENEPCAQTTII